MSAAGHAGNKRALGLLAFIVVAIVASRLILSTVGVVSGAALDRPDDFFASPVNVASEAARDQVSRFEAVKLWYNWDAQHYENLSRQWLDVSRPLPPNVVTPDGGRAWNEFSWPPLYPLSVAGLHGITGLKAGQVMLAMNLVLFGVFLFLVREIVKSDGADDDAARWAIAMNVAAPFAFFLTSALTEPLFVTLAAASLLSLRRRWWIAAGFLASAMVWTKMTGVLMVVPLGIAAAIDIRDRRRAGQRPDFRVLFAPGLCAAAYVGYLSFAWFLTGTPRAPFMTQRYGWGNTVGNPVSNLITHLDHWQYIAVAVLMLLCGVLWKTGWLGSVDAAYCMVMLLSATMVVQIIGAAPRYTAVAFPIFSAIGLWAHRRRIAVSVVAASALAQMGLFVLWSNYWLVEMF